MKVLYIAVTADEYELPLAVGDTADELAYMIGVSRQRVYEKISFVKRRRIPKHQKARTKLRCYKVEVDEE